MAHHTALIGKRVPVLEKGWIELQDMMGDDLAIVNAARVSYLDESKGTGPDKKLLFYLLRNRHTTPFEQVEFKFRVRAPVLVWWQWARHRTWSFNAQSGRYTPFQDNDFYFPTEWRRQAQSNRQMSEGKAAEEEGAELSAALAEHYERSFALYQAALQKGVARELARIFLPGFSLFYTWVAKTDAHNLMHFMDLRMGSHAQEEIRAYAKAIYTEFFCLALPWTADAFERYVMTKHKTA